MITVLESTTTVKNLAWLRAELVAWLHRADLTDRIDTFILLAESEINTEARMRLMEVDVYLTLAAGTRTVALPERFIEPICLELAIAGQSESDLIYRTPDDITVNQSYAGRPLYWTINGETIEFEHNADQDYPLKFRLMQGFEIEATESNALLTKYPGIYLYGALLHSAPFLVNDQRLAIWERLYERTLALMLKAEARTRNLAARRTDIPQSMRTRGSSFLGA